jgi:hypothetical protein
MDRATKIINMKKEYLIFVILILFSACFTERKQGNRENYDVKKTMDLFVDSLKKNGVDTIVTYYNGCHGCAEGVLINGSIFWKRLGSFYEKKLNNYFIYKETMQCSDIIGYFMKHQYEIRNEKLFDTLTILNYHYIEISVYYGNGKYHIEVPEDYILSNDDKSLINWIYRIESCLFDIYIKQYNR